MRRRLDSRVVSSSSWVELRWTDFSTFQACRSDGSALETKKCFVLCASRAAETANRSDFSQSLCMTDWIILQLSTHLHKKRREGKNEKKKREEELMNVDVFVFFLLWCHCVHRRHDFYRLGHRSRAPMLHHTHRPLPDAWGLT